MAPTKKLGSLEFSFSDTPLAQTHRICRVLPATPGSPATSLMLVAICRYCSGLYQRAGNVEGNNEDFVCVHCIRKINEEMERTNNMEEQPRVQAVQGLQSDLLNIRTILLHLRKELEASEVINERKFSDILRQLESLASGAVAKDLSCAKPVSSSTQTEIETREAWTQTGTEAGVFNPLCSNMGTLASVFESTTCEANRHKESDEPKRQIPSTKMMPAHLKAFRAGPAVDDGPPSQESLPKSVLIAGSSNISRIGENVCSMLNHTARCNVSGQNGALLSQVVAEICRHIAIYNVRPVNQLLILHAGLEDVLKRPDNIELDQLWSSLDMKLDELITVCDENKIRLSVCSLPVVTGGPGLDFRRDCEYINSKMAAKFRRLGIFFRDLSYIQRAKATTHVDGVHFTWRGAKMAARPIAREVATFLGIKADVWKQDSHSRRESPFLFLRTPPPPLPPMPPPFLLPPENKTLPPMAPAPPAFQLPQGLMAQFRSLPPQLPHPSTLPQAPTWANCKNLNAFF